MPAYLDLYHSGKLSERVLAARDLLHSCIVCPRRCGVNRLADETGKCKTGRLAVVSSYGPHFGEESPLVGMHGSGTIFFTNCNLKCVYCQNSSISQLGEGFQVTKEELAGLMISLQENGCHNINLVSPTHVVPQILEALEVSIKLGLKIPVVYNTGGYDSLEVLEILDGIVDIYMPDMKYADTGIGLRLSGVDNYPDINQTAIKEMYRQVGELSVDDDGIASRGLLIRHLVLPHKLAGTENTVRFIADELSRHSYVNIMDQYRPCYKALEYQQLSRALSAQEYTEAVKMAYDAGLTGLDKKHTSVLNMIR